MINQLCKLSIVWPQEKAPQEKYGLLVDWARKARGTNPMVFDEMIGWLLDDAQWTEEKLKENHAFLMEDVIGELKKQNAQLRQWLNELEPFGVVNPAAFSALDRFDEALRGENCDYLQEAVSKMFGDFAAMKDRSLREQIAGCQSGPAGTDTIHFFGYINGLKDFDAGVQWALFMPDMVKAQQQGFRVDSFEYRKLPAMRFIGFEGEEYADVSVRLAKIQELDVLAGYQTEIQADILFMHHYGLGVDVGPWHGVWGRFMKADTPVPEGFLYFDFVPVSDEEAGLPYVSQFAYATFSGDMAAMHRQEGFDSDAMYDVTRNIILGQGVMIPYPHKYWTAEVFPEGCDKDSTAYMFSVLL